MLNIPNKSHFKMNEVCGLTGVKPYVLRFWESEFSEIDPVVSSSGQKLYEHKDIEAIAVIKKMLFDEKQNIEQAKAELSLRLSHEPAQQSEVVDAVGDDEGATTPQQSTVVSRMELSEEDIKGLDGAKMHLRSILEKTSHLKETHHWS